MIWLSVEGGEGGGGGGGGGGELACTELFTVL